MFSVMFLLHVLTLRKALAVKRATSHLPLDHSGIQRSSWLTRVLWLQHSPKLSSSTSVLDSGYEVSVFKCCVSSLSDTEARPLWSHLSIGYCSRNCLFRDSFVNTVGYSFLAFSWQSFQTSHTCSVFL